MFGDSEILDHEVEAEKDGHEGNGLANVSDIKLALWVRRTRTCVHRKRSRWQLRSAGYAGTLEPEFLSKIATINIPKLATLQKRTCFEICMRNVKRAYIYTDQRILEENTNATAARERIYGC